MGARPSSFRKGGGFLNDVDGVITSLTFTDTLPNGEEFKPGKDPKTKKERFHSLFARLGVRVDGADEDVETSLFAGSADDFTIAEDGSQVWDSNYETAEEAAAAEEAGESVRQLGASTAFGKFLKSMVDGGFPETLLPEYGLDFSAIIDARCHFVQRKNEEDTKRLGKRKGKDGKEYDRQDLLVEQVFSYEGSTEAEETPTTKGKTSTTPSKKGAPPTPAAKKTAKKSEEDEIAEQAVDVLTTVLAAQKDHTLPKSKLSMKVLTAAKGPHKEAIRKLIFTDDFLAREEGWSYDKKKGLVTLDEAEGDGDE